jgi:transcriptional regulator with XRE-family HTH domain
MKNNDFKTLGDYGIRFILFRKAIKKTQLQLAKETGIAIETIDETENGRKFPEINYLHTLNKRYGLNINWILSGDGDMFIKDLVQNLNSQYVLKHPHKKMETEDELYKKFIVFMQVPAIRKVMLESWEVLKKELRED